MILFVYNGMQLHSAVNKDKIRKIDFQKENGGPGARSARAAGVFRCESTLGIISIGLETCLTR